MRKRASAAVIGLAIAGVSMFATGSASSHGYTDSPISRQKLCANGTVTDCGNIQWEPQSVEGPKGFPAAGPADGKICAGGNSAVRPARRPARRQLARHPGHRGAGLQLPLAVHRPALHERLPLLHHQERLGLHASR